MTFGLPSWLKSTHDNLGLEVPVWYPCHDQPDHREWLVTNGLGGYACGTISGAHTRRYHGVLAAALRRPGNRHMCLSRVDEFVTLGDTVYELSTNHWASGVVAPTGYKLIESFTTVPCPTWVYHLGEHYLIKQLCLRHGSDEVVVGYSWLPDREHQPRNASITIRLLAGFRSIHGQTGGSGASRYRQSLLDGKAILWYDGTDSSLHLEWNSGEYQEQEQWWWSYFWPEEAARGLPDQEDLYLFGTLTADLMPGRRVELGASLGSPGGPLSFQTAADEAIKRQQILVTKASLPRSQDMNLLVLACDQFLVKREANGTDGLTVMAGYPWFMDSGRDALISLPGLTLSTRRYDQAKEILETVSSYSKGGLIPGMFAEESGQPSYLSADPTLWWAWSLYHYLKTTRDVEFVRSQYHLLCEAARHYVDGTAYGIAVDPRDGLLRCGEKGAEATWMDAKVADIPITPRTGKAVEICALWYNFLETLLFFAAELGEEPGPYRSLAQMCHSSLQKFWNSEKQCLYDVLEPGNDPSAGPVDSLRPNQILAVSLPFRAFTSLQEKSILTAVDMELLTPVGLRSLSPTDPSYQARYGCGFSRADQYHRDLSYHQGTVWPWLIGPYCEALLNVYGPLPETYQKIRILLQPFINHIMEEGCVGSISEIFDGTSPHNAHGCFAQAWSVAEIMRMMALVARSA